MAANSKSKKLWTNFTQLHCYWQEDRKVYLEAIRILMRIPDTDLFDSPDQNFGGCSSFDNIMLDSFKDKILHWKRCELQSWTLDTSWSGSQFWGLLWLYQRYALWWVLLYSLKYFILKQLYFDSVISNASKKYFNININTEISKVLQYP